MKCYVGFQERIHCSELHQGTYEKRSIRDNQSTVRNRDHAVQCFNYCYAISLPHAKAFRYFLSLFLFILATDITEYLYVISNDYFHLISDYHLISDCHLISDSCLQLCHLIDAPL